MLGAICHRKLQSFSPSGRVSAARGFRSIVFCNTLLRRVGAAIFLIKQRMLGAIFHNKTAGFLSERPSLPSPRLQIHCLLPYLFAANRDCGFPRHAASARCKISKELASCCLNGRVCTTHGFQTIVSCHAFQRRVEAVTFPNMQRVLGTISCVVFEQKEEFSRPATSPPRGSSPHSGNHPQDRGGIHHGRVAEEG